MQPIFCCGFAFDVDVSSLVRFTTCIFDSSAYSRERTPVQKCDIFYGKMVGISTRGGYKKGGQMLSALCIRDSRSQIDRRISSSH